MFDHGSDKKLFEFVFNLDCSVSRLLGKASKSKVEKNIYNCTTTLMQFLTNGHMDLNLVKYQPFATEMSNFSLLLALKEPFELVGMNLKTRDRDGNHYICKMVYVTSWAEV